MVVVSSTTTMAGTTSPVTNSVAANPLSTVPTFSNHNGQPEENDAGDVSPSAYQLLLKQVESLRMENSTLKAELKSNTSHISKLETEASRMKDMVLMLGTTAHGCGLVEADISNGSDSFNQVGTSYTPNNKELHEDNIASTPTLNLTHMTMLQPPMKLLHGLDQSQDARRRRPEFLMGLPIASQNLHHPSQLDQSLLHQSTSLRSVSPSPSMAVTIRVFLTYLQEEKASSLRTLNLEEQKKEYYLKQLKELTSRLDSVSDCDKFTKPNDKMRQQVEMEIVNLQKTMEKNLGSSDVMQERLDARLQHIQMIQNEIASFEQRLRKLEGTPASLGSPTLFTSHSGIDRDGATCFQHARYNYNDRIVGEISTQTANFNDLMEGIRYEEEFSVCDNSGMDVPLAAGPGRMSRGAQTVVSCVGVWSRHSFDVHAMSVALPHHDPLASRSGSEHKRPGPGSTDSMRSQSDIDETASMHSFTTSLPRHFSSSFSAKKDGGLSPSLSRDDKEELVRQVLKMGETVEGCWSMRQNGCISSMIQIMHDGLLLNLSPNFLSSSTIAAMKNAIEMRITLSQVLRSIVNTSTEAKPNVETQILSTLEYFRRYCEQLVEFWIFVNTMKDGKKEFLTGGKIKPVISPPNGFIGASGNAVGVHSTSTQVSEKNHELRTALSMVYNPPIDGITGIMKWSSNEQIKRVVNDYGGLHAVAELFVLHCRCMSAADRVQLSLGDDAPRHDDRTIVLLRRFIGFVLINLTYGDTVNKTTLIQMPGLIDTVMAQMNLSSEDMQQVMGLLIRNLSWQPDEKCRDILKQKNIVAIFMKLAFKSKREDNLNSLLSALWNLSGHCPENRANICSVKGALAFLVSTLTYRVPEIMESGGGILRNISSVVATNEEYRKILREKNCLQILLTHLKSASLTIVSNACGTLWNLSARNAHDQKLLWDLGAVPMLRNLVHSKHSVIAQGSTAALRNLLANRPGNVSTDFEKSESAKLKARKQKGAEYFDGNKTSPLEQDKFSPRHHAAQSSAQEKMIFPCSAMISQRYSLQEKSSSSPVPELEKARRFQRAALHGSLGSLPTTEFTESFSMSHPGPKYIPTARNSNSYPDHYSSHASTSAAISRKVAVPHHAGTAYKNSFAPVGVGMLKDVMIFSDTAQSSAATATVQPSVNSKQSNMSLRQCLKMIGESKSSRATSATSPSQEDVQKINEAKLLSAENGQSGNGQHARSPYYPTELLPATWGGDDQASLASPGNVKKRSDTSQTKDSHQPQAHGVQKLMLPLRVLGAAKNPNVLVPKCHEDLAKRLQHVEDDYDNDDNPVNYSLHYTDEHMTPGVQSPRTEEIYELTAPSVNPEPSAKVPPPELRRNYMHSQMSPMPSTSLNGPATKSDGGLSGLSSCIGSTGSSARQDGSMRVKTAGLPNMDGSGQSSLKSIGVNYPADHKIVDPSSYDFSYDDERPTNFGAIYSEEPLYETIQHESMGMQPYAAMEQQSFPGSSDPVGPQSTAKSAENAHSSENASDRAGDVNPELREEHDKFDTGGITPANYYSHHRSGRNSGIVTPRTPFDNTPMMCSPGSSVGSISDGESIHSSYTSEPASRMMSGAVSPSHLPDSPSQSMPMSPRRSPPPRVIDPHPADADNLKRNQSTPLNSEQRNNIVKPLSMPGSLAPKTESVSNPLLGERIQRQIRKIELPGYISSLPINDEVSQFRSEDAMSEMTKFSALTVGTDDKIQPLADQLADGLQSSGPKSSPHAGENLQSRTTRDVTKSAEASSLDKAVFRDRKMMHIGQRAVHQAGYITSLPTNDEIKKFIHEGTLSPMTAFSEISCLKEDNEGFLKSTGSVLSVTNSVSSNRATGSRSVSSNKNSFASRSSATGASVPPAPPQKWHGDRSEDAVINAAKENTLEEKASKFPIEPTDVSNRASQSVAGEDKDFQEDTDSDSLPSSSSDDEELLKQCIRMAEPKKSKSSVRGSSSKYSSKSSRPSRSKDKTHSQVVPGPSAKKEEDLSFTNPSPEAVAAKECRRVNIKQKIESANKKLNGVHIVDYIDNLINGSEGMERKVAGISLASSNTISKQVIGNAETLQQSYSVRKKLKEAEKQTGKTPRQEIEGSRTPTVNIPKTTGLMPSEPSSSMQSKMRVQNFIRETTATYATEGTPIEMSRSTSLSNITIESDEDDNVKVLGIRSNLKMSHSVPDMQSTPSDGPSDKHVVMPVTSIPSSVRGASIAGSDRSSPGTKDSREILEVLGKQIESLSLTTVENVITSHDPGYTRSLPQTDEILKYEAEGSQFGGTEFSALTIDSDTKIAPGVPTELQPTSAPPQATPPPIESQLNERSSAAHYSPSHGHPLEDASAASRDMTSATGNNQMPPWHETNKVQPSSHYNNENDNLGMKEEKMNYMIEDTPLNLSSAGSLSSLDFGSDDDNDLLNACITSALPPERKSSNPPFPLVMTQHCMTHDAGLGRHNHGVPDGKVDSPTGQQLPLGFPLVQRPQNFQSNFQRNGQGFSPNGYTPTEEQFSVFRREAEIMSARLMQQSQYHANTGYAGPPSSNIPLSSSQSLSQPTENFYRISRQPSTQDSDLSVSSSVLGERQAYDASKRNVRSPHGSAPHGRKNGARQRFEQSSARARGQNERAPKSGKKYSVGKQREVITARRGKNHANRARDSSSGSSSSYRNQQRQRHMSADQVCNCHIVCSRPSAQPHCYHHGPVSASASRLEGAKSPSKPRRKSTNSASKNSVGARDHISHHHHHPPKPSRPRNSSKSRYRPSVVQLYPPLKDMVGVLQGVASVAARGDKVVADRNPPQYSSNVSKKSSSSSLVRSATFINKTPSDILLESMTQEEKEQYVANSSSSSLSLVRSQKSSRSAGKARASSPHGSSRSSKQKSRVTVPSPCGSTHSLKAQSKLSTKSKVDANFKADKSNSSDVQAKPSKSKKVWKGIKKLLSPSDEPSESSKDGEKKGAPSKSGQKSTSKPAPDAKKTAYATTKQVIRQKTTTSEVRVSESKTADLSGSSLSLSSSSASNHSSDGAFRNVGSAMQNAPYGLLPKSPSVNAVMRRTVSAIPQSRSLGILSETKPPQTNSTVWRKAPPKPAISTASISQSSATGPLDTAYKNSMTSLGARKDVWVSKKAVASANGTTPTRSEAAASLMNQVSRGHNYQSAVESNKVRLSGTPVSGFHSAQQRTQSPRVVQQVAPFNYKPSSTGKRPDFQNNAPDDKSANQPRKINPDCKQTPV